MKRFLICSSLALILSIGSAAQSQAQMPTGYQNQWGYPNYNYNYNRNYGGYGSNNNLNDALTLYYYNNGYQTPLPNVVTSNRWSGQPAFNYNQSYMVNGQRMRVVPYPSPNYYAAPRYMFIPQQ